MTRRAALAVKRLLDVTVAALALAAAGVPMLVIACVVRVTMGRPVLHVAPRPGRHGVEFRHLKFRTMRDGDAPDHERITRAGRFLRSTSLDELPQLLNVLRGEMSLVGPRPLLPRYLDRYTPRQARRHEMRPGLTGLAQVAGRNQVTWADRLELDVRYVDEWSLRLDLRILARTVPMVLRRSGVSADGHATMPELRPRHSPEGRLPDFLVIGLTRAGSTTLYRRLGEHPDVVLPELKEPDFFTAHHDRGLAWYRELFAACPPDLVTFEASVDCTAPPHAAEAAARIAAVLPSVPLVVLLRHPVERTRSHYLHEVQRGRERRAFLHALADPANPYVLGSTYSACLGPYLDGPLRENLVAVRTEDLDDEGTWKDLLVRLGLDPVPIPEGVAQNPSSGKEPFTRAGSVLWRLGALQRAGAIPKPIRRLGRGLVVRPSSRVDRLRASADRPVPEALREALLADAWETGDRLGIDLRTWT